MRCAPPPPWRSTTARRNTPTRRDARERSSISAIFPWFVRASASVRSATSSNGTSASRWPRAERARTKKQSTQYERKPMQTRTVNAGGRLDRLPVSKFHWRVLGLIAGGMFLDAFEIYLAGGVLGALVKSGWSDLARNAQFISMTFAGMVLGAWFAGILGGRYGRRFSYQANLLIFGLASFAAAAAPSMPWLIAARFVMGLGLGAEIVVGYVTMTEFVPPQQRAKWGAGLAALTNTGLFIASFAGFLIIPTAGWRWMFVIVGVGALFVWYLRKAMPESPR